MALLQPYGFHKCCSQRGPIPGLQSFDYKVSYTIYRDLGRRLPRSSLLFLEHLGGPVLFPIVLFFGCFPNHYFSIRFRTFCLNLFLGFLTDLMLVGALKFLVRRPRPSYHDFGDYILVVDVDRYSFPSGHASRSIFVALLWLMWHLGHWWHQCIVLWWAAATSMSRVLLGRHYFLDVVAGSVIAMINLLIISKASLQ